MASESRLIVFKLLYIRTAPECLLLVLHSHFLGLPASNIAVSGERLYWSSPDGVFFVNRSTLSGPVGVLSETALSARILSLSPGQQLITGEFEGGNMYLPHYLSLASLLADQDCLSPSFSSIAERPTPLRERYEITNTTVNVFWEMTLRLTQCDEQVFSVPPFSYNVRYEIDMVEGTLFAGVSRYNVYSGTSS